MTQSQHFVVDVQHDAATDDYYIQFTDEMLAITGWQIGEELTWTHSLEHLAIWDTWAKRHIYLD